MPHCDDVNDFPVVNGTPGIIQDPIDLLLTKYNFTTMRLAFVCLLEEIEDTKKTFRSKA